MIKIQRVSLTAGSTQTVALTYPGNALMVKNLSTNCDLHVWTDEDTASNYVTIQPGSYQVIFERFGSVHDIKQLKITAVGSGATNVEIQTLQWN